MVEAYGLSRGVQPLAASPEPDHGTTDGEPSVLVFGIDDEHYDLGSFAACGRQASGLEISQPTCSMGLSQTDMNGWR